MFIRVRGAKPTDPMHEFDVSESYLKLHPDLFKVLDKTPVDQPRPVKYVTRTKKSTSRKKPGENKTTAPAGDDS